VGKQLCCVLREEKMVQSLEGDLAISKLVFNAFAYNYSGKHLYQYRTAYLVI
jgi:hypothetical protein